MDIFRKFTGDEDYEAWRLLDHAHKVIYQVRGKELKQYGVTPEDVSVFLRVEQLGKDATPIAIARLGGQTRSAIHEMLKKIIRKGLILKSNNNKGNNRAVRVLLTDSGKDAFNHANKRHSLHEIFGCLSSEEKLQLTMLLTKLWSNAVKMTDR